MPVAGPHISYQKTKHAGWLPFPICHNLGQFTAFAQLCNYIRVRAEVQQLIDVHLPRGGDPEPAKPPEQRPLEVQQEGI